MCMPGKVYAVLFSLFMTGVAGAQDSRAAPRSVLLPEPRQLVYREGRVALSSLVVSVAADAPADIRFALNELKSVVKERTGGIERRKVFFKWKVTNEVGNKEYYRLVIDQSGVRVKARTPAGLYYAVQTIRQLIAGEGRDAVLPMVEIEDQPALAYRGVMMDLAHGGLPTVDEIKRQMAFLSRWKVNQYYFYNEVSIEMKGYEGMNYGAAYTQEQVKDIVAYGRRRQIDVIPFVAFYGHLHDLLKQEKYASMAIGKYGEELDPRKPEVRSVTF